MQNGYCINNSRNSKTSEPYRLKLKGTHREKAP